MLRRGLILDLGIALGTFPGLRATRVYKATATLGALDATPNNVMTQLG
jgi:hypothetical protein